MLQWYAQPWMHMHEHAMHVLQVRQLFRFHIQTTSRSMQVALSWHSVWWVPTPQPADAPAAQFSEGRAMAQTSALADDIGDRAVS